MQRQLPSFERAIAGDMEKWIKAIKDATFPNVTDTFERESITV